MNPRSLAKPFLGILSLVSALALAMASPEETGSSYAERPRRVRVAEVSSVSAARSVHFSGVTRAADRAALAFSIGARLESRPVEVGQTVAAGRLLARLDDRELRHAVTAAAARLADVNARLARAESERRRVEITRALVQRPKFMLLDEPFAGIDPIAVHDIQEIVRGLKDRGIGVIISDHNVEQTLEIVDRAYIMYEGRIRVSGTVSELVWNEEVAEIYLGPALTARMRQRYPRP